MTTMTRLQTELQDPAKHLHSLAPSARRPAHLQSLLLCLLLPLALSCFGGGDFAATGGMSGTGISQGSVTAFGSIFVNGVEWNISSSSIEIDGMPASESELRLGMVVRVEGRRLSALGLGIATQVVFDDSVEGPIADDPETSSDGLERTFTVLNTIVVIELDSTHFDDGATFEGLAKGDVVEVSGFLDELGQVRATRVELKGTFPDVDEVELKGVISDLDTDDNSFSLGTLLVRYDDAGGTIFDDLADENDLENGLFVEVEGTLSLLDEIDARVIELEDEEFDGDDGDEVELEGIVSNVSSQTEFFVAGVQVDASDARFDPPGLVITAGLHVEVEGILSGGVLIADEVESKDEEDEVRIAAAVTSVDTTARSLTILGVDVQAVGDTELEDESDADLPNFRFDDIQPGDWLEIRGSAVGEAEVVASEIDREEDGDDVILRGPVTEVDSGAMELSILGQPIPVDEFTEYEDEDENSLTAEQFFDPTTGVALDDIVKAKDQDALDASILGVADEVSFEGDET